MSKEWMKPYHEAQHPRKYANSARRSGRALDLAFGRRAEGLENIPLHGATIFAFRHRSLLDPWFLGSAIPRAINGMAKQEIRDKRFYLGLGSIYLSNRGVFYVDRNNPARGTYDDAVEILKLRKALAMAPEGTHHNEGIELGPTRLGVARIAIKAAQEGVESKVVPVAMTTDYLRLFRTVNIAFGEPLVTPMTEIDTIRQRRETSSSFEEEIRLSLQETTYRAFDLQT